jgi:putrescine---pyruvate transaminase
MRAVGDRMIIAPPLVITPAEIDVLIERAKKSLDESYASLKADGMFVAGLTLTTVVKTRKNRNQ